MRSNAVDLTEFQNSLMYDEIPWHGQTSWLTDAAFIGFDSLSVTLA